MGTSFIFFSVFNWLTSRFDFQTYQADLVNFLGTEELREVSVQDSTLLPLGDDDSIDGKLRPHAQFLLLRAAMF